MKSIHHLHIRKRIYKKFEKYPHPNLYIRFLDKFIFVIASIGPLFNIPQIYKIYYFKNAMGISITSWILFAVCNIPWIIYGVVHKEKPIVIANCFWLISHLIIILGALLYQ